jgi:hypothetical protein
MDAKSPRTLRTYFLSIGVALSVGVYLKYEGILVTVGDYLVERITLN